MAIKCCVENKTNGPSIKSFPKNVSFFLSIDVDNPILDNNLTRKWDRVPLNQHPLIESQGLQQTEITE